MAHEDDWELGSGFALDGATGTITAAEFGYNNSLGAGITCLNITVTDDDTGEEHEQSFSVGKNFEANRDGSAIEGNGRINKNSNYGILLASVLDVVDNPGDVIGSPKEAGGWIGTKWTFGTIERETTNTSTGVTKMASKFIVTAYHGKAGDGSGKSTAKKATATKSSGGSKPAADIDQELWDKLVEMAGEYDDHEAFVEAAIELPEVDGSKAAQKAVMQTKAGSIWATAKG